MEDEENPGNYYYYYNVNLTNLSAYSLTGNDTVSFEVNITSGNSGGTFVITKPSLISNKGSIQKIIGLYGTNPSSDGSFQPKVNGTALEINQQINTPITTDGTYLYFGTWGGGTAAGSYYQVNISTGATKVFTPSGYGFYWAGAACDSSRVYFGSDNGMLYWRSRTAFDTTGGSLDLKSTSVGGATDAGNVRSTIMIDGDELYFTSQGGYLWCCYFDGGLYIDWKTALRNSGKTANVTCTSTPTKVGNRIYVGCYGGSGKSGVKCVDATAHTEKYVIQDNSLVVQCSIVVKGTGTGTDYLYFVTNAAAGKGYCYSWDGTNYDLVWDSTTASPTWTDPNHTVNCTYALGGMSIENGIAVFGNDHNYVYIVE